MGLMNVFLLEMARDGSRGLYGTGLESNGTLDLRQLFLDRDLQYLPEDPDLALCLCN